MGGGQPQVVTTNTAPWKGQQKYLLKGFDMAEKMFNQVPDYYPGETVAGFDPLQTMAQEGAANYITGERAGKQQQYAEQALLRGLSGQTGIPTSVSNRLISGQVGEYNPFSSSQYSDLLAGNVRTGAGTPYQAMADALSGDVVDRLQSSILPSIRQQQVMYQPGGSSRSALEQNKAVTSAVKQGLTTPLAQMYSNAYQTAQGMRLPASSLYADAYQQAQGRILPTAQQSLDQQIKAMGMYPSIMAAPLSMYGALGDIGAQRRALTQATMDADMARYQYQATAPQQALSNYMNAIQGNYGGQSYQTSPGPSALDQASQILGMVGTGVALAGSDRRIKNNIVPEGSKWKGLNVYSFNYIGDDTPRRGVMAQEAEVLYPHAVHEVGGIKFVDYGAI